MKKVTQISIYGIGASSRGTSSNGLIAVLVAVDKKLDFSAIRDYMKKDWRLFLNESTPVAKEFRYKCTITIVDDKGTRISNFEIDPKNLR